MKAVRHVCKGAVEALHFAELPRPFPAGARARRMSTLKPATNAEIR